MIAATKVYEFGEFRVDTIQRRLSRSGEIVPLHSKAFDVLLVLMNNAGRDVSKDELLEAVWPNQILEESNLAVNISAIRRALGESAAQSRFIVTIPGFGYRFIGRVREASNPMVGLVIERETISEVSFEHEAEVASDNAKTRPLAGSRTARGRLSSFVNSRSVLLSLGVVGLVTALTGGFIWWRHARANDLSARFRQIAYKQLTNNGNVYNAALSPDGKLFAFVLVQKEKESLHLGQTNSTEQIELRPAAEVSYSGLIFSHDGNTLFYTFADGNADKFDLYKLPALGGIPVKLRDDVGPFFAVSPDDKQVAFARRDVEKGISSILISNIDGSNETTVVSLPATRGLKGRSLDWSPDGSMLSFGANDGINDSHFQMYLTHLASREITLLSPVQWRTMDAAAWLKDGSGLLAIAQGSDPEDTLQLWHIAYPAGVVTRVTKDLATYIMGLGVSDDARSFLSVRLQQFNQIWVMPTDDPARARQITFGSIGSSDGILGLDWTPDNQLVYGSFRRRGQSIWTIDADGAHAKQITAADYDEQMPSVTGDGRTIVFESNRSGGTNIWRANLDGGNATQLTTCGKNFQPNASPDGKWVVYMSTCHGSASLWRVPVSGGEPQQLSDKHLTWPAVSPDGNWVACALTLTPQKSRLAIISIDGGQPAKLFDMAPLGNIRLGFRWSNDGQSIIYRDQRIGLWRQSIDGGAPRRVQGIPSEKIYGFAWSRDNKLFAYTLGAEMRDVVLVSTANTPLDFVSASH